MRYPSVSLRHVAVIRRQEALAKHVRRGSDDRLPCRSLEGISEACQGQVGNIAVAPSFSSVIHLAGHPKENRHTRT
jgi:hypothetical protein